jgi:hypothetical protein
VVGRRCADLCRCRGCAAGGYDGDGGWGGGGDGGGGGGGGEWGGGRGRGCSLVHFPFQFLCMCISMYLYMYVYRRPRRARRLPWRRARRRRPRRARPWRARAWRNGYLLRISKIVLRRLCFAPVPLLQSVASHFRCPLRPTSHASSRRAPPPSRGSLVPLSVGCLVYSQSVEIGICTARANLEPIANLNTRRVKRARAGRYVYVNHTLVCMCVFVCVCVCVCVCVRVRACVRACVWSLARSRAPPPFSLSSFPSRTRTRCISLARALCADICRRMHGIPRNKKQYNVYNFNKKIYYINDNDDRMNVITRNRQWYSVNNFNNYFSLYK